MTSVSLSDRRDEWDSGKFAAEVGGVALAVLGVVQDGVDVVEDVPLGDGGVVVVGTELFEGPVGDVLAAVGAVLREGLRSSMLPACHAQACIAFVLYSLSCLGTLGPGACTTG